MTPSHVHSSHHDHDHDHDHDHALHSDGGVHLHDHDHPSGLKGFLRGLFVPHTHDAADSIDDAMEASHEGVCAR
ncbi:hypothetical protein GCM10023065_29910 [Microbacterium laevaniformans]